MIAQIALFLGEVGDKEFTIPTLWIVAVVLCASGFLLSSWRHWAGILPLLFSLVWCYLIVSELRDPYVGPAIRDELGISYVVQSYLSALLPLAFIAWPLFRRTAKALSCAL
jgi:hypothetical protein